MNKKVKVRLLANEDGWSRWREKTAVKLSVMVSAEITVACEGVEKPSFCQFPNNPFN